VRLAPPTGGARSGKEADTREEFEVDASNLAANPRAPSRGRERSNEERWGGVLAAVVLRMGRKEWASWDLHLPPSFPLCLAVVVPGGGGERCRQRLDRPHPLLDFPVRRWQFSFSRLRLFLLIPYLVDVVRRMRKPP
jgi:hypothetical protein